MIEHAPRWTPAEAVGRFSSSCPVGVEGAPGVVRLPVLHGQTKGLLSGRERSPFYAERDRDGGGGRARRRGSRGGGGRGRFPAAVFDRDRQVRSADGCAGGGAGEADRARRSEGESGGGRGEPAAGGVDREAISQPGGAVPRPDPGGDDRADACNREVRPPQGVQVFDLRDLVDPAGGGAVARR